MKFLKYTASFSSHLTIVNYYKTRLLHCVFHALQASILNNDVDNQYDSPACEDLVVHLRVHRLDCSDFCVDSDHILRRLLGLLQGSGVRLVDILEWN